MVNLKIYVKDLTENVFALLNLDEELGVFIHSEESQFVRFTQSKVRQNTTVFQHEASFRFQKDQKTLTFDLNLTLDPGQDLDLITEQLLQARLDVTRIDPHPQYFPIVNHGFSESLKRVERPEDAEMVEIITDEFKRDDMAGLFCSGPVRQISINSKGQFHFFETDYFFLDYSLYDGPKAAKGFFSTENWDLASLSANALATKNKLALLNRPPITIPRGQYRTYLEPMALQEIISTLSWGGMSFSGLRQGRSPLRKFYDKEVRLSPLFSISENLGLGYVPTFNSLGEIAPESLPLIKDGISVNMLISSASAQEYKVASNHAEPSEAFRSPEVQAGTLDEKNILKILGTGLYLSNLHYINWSDRTTARLTGMTRYACFWVEDGVIKGPIKDLRFDDTVYNILGENLEGLTTQPEIFVDSSTYNRRGLGVMKVPGALIHNFNFTL